MMRQVQMSEPAAFSGTVCCSVHQHLQCAYIIQLNLYKRIVKCIDSNSFFKRITDAYTQSFALQTRKDRIPINSNRDSCLVL